MRDEPRMDAGNVPCNGCTLCCKGDAVRLLPGDDPARYKLEPHPMMPGQVMLAHKSNGDCTYLGEHGCTIHSMRPRMCREMDCRNIAKAWRVRKQARRMAKKGVITMEVWRRGRELLKETTNGHPPATPGAQRLRAGE